MGSVLAGFVCNSNWSAIPISLHFHICAAGVFNTRRWLQISPLSSTFCEFSLSFPYWFFKPTTLDLLIKKIWSPVAVGIGYTLDPKFSFPKIAAPYAQVCLLATVACCCCIYDYYKRSQRATCVQELLDMKQQRPTGPQLVREIRKQADDVWKWIWSSESFSLIKKYKLLIMQMLWVQARSTTISMPYRVQKIEDIVKQLESGDLKLRVRVLESERAARKATVLQMATMYTVCGGTLLNVGVALSSQGNEAMANGSFVAAGVFLTLLITSMRRVQKLDKFEKMIWIWFFVLSCLVYTSTSIWWYSS